MAAEAEARRAMLRAADRLDGILAARKFVTRTEDGRPVWLWPEDLELRLERIRDDLRRGGSDGGGR